MRSRVIPFSGCHRRIRRERVLGAISGEPLVHPGLTGFPTRSTLHPWSKRDRGRKSSRARALRQKQSVAERVSIAEVDAPATTEPADPFEAAIDDALDSLPAELREAISNVEIVVEDEPPDGQSLLGYYRGVPLPQRTSNYSGVLPDKISIFGGPLVRRSGGDADRLHQEIRHVVLHEIAHHFGISDERLIELDRY